MRCRLFLLALVLFPSCIASPPASPAGEADAFANMDEGTRDAFASAEVGDGSNAMFDAFSGVDATPPADAARVRDANAETGVPDAALMRKIWEFQDGVLPDAGYQGTQDTALYRKDPDSNFGSAQQIEVDGSSGRVLLFRWDVNMIAPQSTVTSVELVLHATDNGSEHDIYPVSVPWSDSEATWQQRRSNAPWEVAGCFGGSDRGPTVLGTVAAPTAPLEVRVRSTPALVAAVQRWVDEPTMNHGITIQRQNEGNGITVHSRESSAPAKRPRLIVETTGP